MSEIKREIAAALRRLAELWDNPAGGTLTQDVKLVADELEAEQPQDEFRAAAIELLEASSDAKYLDTARAMRLFSARGKLQSIIDRENAERGN